MKNVALSLFLLLFSVNISAQKWLPLNKPETDLLGKAVIYRNGEITPSPIANKVNNPIIDTSYSSDQVSEYNKQYRAFITKYFSTSKYSVKQASAKKLMIRSLNIGSLNNMDAGADYVYSGLSADSVEITLQAKKGIEANVGDVIKDVASLFTDGASTVVGQVVPFLDSIRYAKDDSVSFRMVLANPNAFYNVKIITFKQLLKYDWERYLQYFGPANRFRNGTDTSEVLYGFKLTWSERQNKNDSWEIYPRFMGRDDKTKLFSLAIKKVNDELKFYIRYRSTTAMRNLEEIEIQPTVVNGKKNWVTDLQLVKSFEFRNRIKFVYIKVNAVQIDDNTVFVFDHDGHKKMTIMQYPEAAFEFRER